MNKIHIVSAMLGVLGIVVFSWWYNAPYNDRLLLVDGQVFHVDIPRDQTGYTQGLSGRDEICARCGMLFVFETSDLYQFWMKDMYFDIDLIWLNEGRIIGITHSASHQTPEKILVPEAPATAVLEVRAGTAEKYDFIVGDRVW